MEPKEGWGETKLGDLCFIKTGERNTQDSEPNGQYPFFVRSPIVEKISTYSYDGEAILVAGDGVGAGRVFHYINGKHDCHQRVYRLCRFLKSINATFLYYFISEFFPRYMESLSDKASVDSLRLPMFQKFIVYFPDVSAQQRIVEQIKSVESTITDLKSKLAKALQLKAGMMARFFG